jgi:hypothetical protein
VATFQKRFLLHGVPPLQKPLLFHFYSLSSWPMKRQISNHNHRPRRSRQRPQTTKEQRWPLQHLSLWSLLDAVCARKSLSVTTRHTLPAAKSVPNASGCSMAISRIVASAIRPTASRRMRKSTTWTSVNGAARPYCCTSRIDRSGGPDSGDSIAERPDCPCCPMMTATMTNNNNASASFVVSIDDGSITLSFSGTRRSPSAPIAFQKTMSNDWPWIMPGAEIG